MLIVPKNKRFLFNLYKKHAMLRLINFLSFLFVLSLAHSQAKLHVEDYQIEIGTILNNQGRYVHKLPIYNIGNEPLIISRARTGDGGSMANYPREIILPGDSNFVEFIYDTKRVGPISRSMTIESNGGRKVVRFKGLVVYQPTQVIVENPVINVGIIPFGETKTAEFYFKNSGDFPLAISSRVVDYFENDLNIVKLTIPNATKEENYFNKYPSGTRLKSTIFLHNTYGNTGPFKREIKFIYNSVDTLTLNVLGSYIGEPWKNSFFSEKNQLFYENNQLYKKTNYNQSGDIIKETLYENGYCTKVSSSWNGKNQVLYILNQGDILWDFRKEI